MTAGPELTPEAGCLVALKPGLPETVRRSRRVKQQQQYQQRYPGLGYAGASPEQRPCQHEGAVPASGTQGCRILFTWSSPSPRPARTITQRNGCGHPVSRKITGDPFGAGERDQEHLASLRTWRLQPQPLPSPTIHPLKPHLRPSLNITSNE